MVTDIGAIFIANRDALVPAFTKDARGEELTAEERMILGTLAERQISAAEWSYRINPDRIPTQILDVQGMPYLKRMWEANRHRLDSEFVEFLEEASRDR